MEYFWSIHYSIEILLRIVALYTMVSLLVIISFGDIISKLVYSLPFMRVTDFARSLPLKILYLWSILLSLMYTLDTSVVVGYPYPFPKSTPDGIGWGWMENSLPVRRMVGYGYTRQITGMGRVSWSLSVALFPSIQVYLSFLAKSYFLGGWASACRLRHLLRVPIISIASPYMHALCKHARPRNSAAKMDLQMWF